MFEVLLASGLAGLATGLGAIPIIIFGKLRRRLYDALLGLAAGIMLSAASFSLITPALEMGGLWLTIAGVALGAVLLIFLERVVPHLEPHFCPDASCVNLRQGVLMTLAITIHNFPEGLAVGVGYASDRPNLGLLLAIAIAAQNIPEGLAVAAPLRYSGISRLRSALYATGSGLAEPMAALVGVAFMGLLSKLAPLGLALAGGAMIYVVTSELIPECHHQGNEKEASVGVIIGFLVMLAINQAFS